MFSLKTSMKKIQFQVTKTQNFECLGMSNAKVFDQFGLIGFRRNDRIR